MSIQDMKYASEYRLKIRIPVDHSDKSGARVDIWRASGEHPANQIRDALR